MISRWRTVHLPSHPFSHQQYLVFLKKKQSTTIFERLKKHRANPGKKYYDVFKLLRKQNSLALAPEKVNDKRSELNTSSEDEEYDAEEMIVFHLEDWLKSSTQLLDLKKDFILDIFRVPKNLETLYEFIFHPM